MIQRKVWVARSALELCENPTMLFIQDAIIDWIYDQGGDELFVEYAVYVAKVMAEYGFDKESAKFKEALKKIEQYGYLKYEKEQKSYPFTLETTQKQDTRTDALLYKIPALNKLSDCPCCDYETTLYIQIQHVNDVHEWSREMIADWLEVLPFDLSFT